jgi:hypothetical protein
MKELLNPRLALQNISTTRLDRKIILGIVVAWILYAGIMILGVGKDILALARITLVEPFAHLSGTEHILVYKALIINTLAFLFLKVGFYLVIFFLFNWVITHLLRTRKKDVSTKALINVFLYSYFFRRVLYVLALCIFFLQTRIFPTADQHLQLFDIAGLIMLVAQIGVYVYGIKILITKNTLKVR